MRTASQQSSSKIMTVVLVSLVTLLGYASTYRLVSKSGSGIPCAKCDTEAIHPFQMKKLAPICGACGDVFGHGYEHCCLCHEYFLEQCMAAF
jgi:hypothetical protein